MTPKSVSIEASTASTAPASLTECKFEGRDLSQKKRTASDWMIERIDSVSGRFIYSHPMGIVEPVFANIRHMLGLDRFTLRIKVKVSAQWKMYAMVHNLFKIYRYGWSPG